MYLAPNSQHFLSRHTGLDVVALPLISPLRLCENALTALLLPYPFSKGLSLASWCEELV